MMQRNSYMKQNRFIFSTELIPGLSRSSSIWIPTTMNLSSQEGFAWVLLWAWWRPHHLIIQSSMHPSLSPLILSPRTPIHLFTHLPLIIFLLFIHLDLSSHLPTDPPTNLPSIHPSFHSSIYLSTRSINIHYIRPLSNHYMEYRFEQEELVSYFMQLKIYLGKLENGTTICGQR